MLYKFAKFGFSMLLAAFVSSFLVPELGIAVGCVFVVAGFVFWAALKKFDAARLCCFAAATGMIVVSLYLANEYYPQKALDGLSAEVTGRVTEMSFGQGRPSYTVKTDYISIDGAPQKITFKLIDWSKSDINVYDQISATVTFFTFDEEEISEVLTNRSGGVAVYAYMDSPLKVTGEYRKFPEYTIYSIREKLSSVINKNFSGWRAQFTNKLLFGSGNVNSEIKDAFRTAGMSHILAISGMHLVVIMGLLEKLLRYKNTNGLPLLPKTAILMGVTVIYMAVAGLGMSIMRAGFMLLISYFAKLLWAESASIDNLGFSVIAVLLIDPLACCDVGFLMSVLSSGGIILFSERLYKLMTGKLKKEKETKFIHVLVRVFAVGIVAWAAALPVAIFAFGGASLIAPFSNIFSGFFSQWAIIFSFLSVFFGLIPYGSVLAMVCATAAQLFEDLLLETARFFGGLPFAYVYTNEEWIKIWLIGSALILSIPLISKGKTYYFKHAVFMSSLVFLCGMLCHSVVYAGTVSTEVIALEQGVAIVAEKDGSTILIANGLNYDDYYKLRSGGRSMDLFISMSADTSPIELDLMREFSPKLALLSGTDALERCVDALPVSSGEVDFWNGGSVKIIPERAVEIDTNGILILYIFEECDIMDIDPRFRSADIVILENVSPNKYPALRCSYMVLRKRENVLSGANEVIILDEGKRTFISRGKNIRKGWAVG